MGFLLFAAFVGVPLLEIAVFIAVGGQIGLWPTLAIVILTAIAGTTLLRWQGFTTLYKAREQMARGEVPVAELFDGLCLIAAGALLLTPGFVTDAVGLLLFIPPVRRQVQRWLGTYLKARTTVYTNYGPGPNGPGPDGGPVIDGEFTEVDSDRDKIDGARRVSIESCF